MIRSLLRAALGTMLVLWLSPALPAPAADDPAFRTAAAMGRGVNVLGYDGIWTGAADAPFRLSDFGLIRRAGFGHVRINIFGFRYLDAGLRLDATMLDQLDTVLDHAVAAGPRARHRRA